MMWTYIWRCAATICMVLMTIEMWKLLKWQRYQQAETVALVECNLVPLKALLEKIDKEDAEK